MYVAVGEYHSCAVLQGGRVRCWGSGEDGRLGYGNTDFIGDDEAPKNAGDVDVGGSVTQIALGMDHTCALLTNGKVRCWGNGDEGKLGYGNTNHIGDDEPPSRAGDVDVGGPVAEIAAGGAFTCARLTSGDVRCWGWGGGGRLGYAHTNSIGDDETPASAGSVDVGGRAVDIATGVDHTCVSLAEGNVRCWGIGEVGRLGYGNVTSVGDDEPPSRAGDVDVGGPAASIAAGLAHTCAVLKSGSIRCWGAGGAGRLGYGNTNHIGDDELPKSAGDVACR